MNGFFESTCLALFLFLMLMPGIYGLHMYVLMFLAHRRGRRVWKQQEQVIANYQKRPEESWPRVTTQIPLYNELTVAQRVIEAVARMDYPAGRHEIQVLDDSTDGTRSLVEQVALKLRKQGHDIQVIRRPDRANYKAGALEYGLQTASGEYVAVFDADFVPGPQFLRQLVPLIDTDPTAGCVQGRWGHLNESESWITQGLALGIDGHFGVEQGARAWNGLLLNFNGTGGIWRKTTITDPNVGGWQGDTLTEDLDLSYRAQMVGWKIIYCSHEICPAEIPANVDALKTQQRRWATGSIQVAVKLLPHLWRSKTTLLQKIEGTLHLTQYTVSLLMIPMALFGRLIISAVPHERAKPWLDATSWLVLASALAPSLAYIYARWSLGGRLTALRSVVKLIVLGLGLSVNNGFAVLVGLIQKGGEFVRTPKSGSRGASAGGGHYAAIRSRLWLIELTFGAICLFQWLWFLPKDGISGIFLLFYAAGLFALGWASRPRPQRPRRLRVAPESEFNAAPEAANSAVGA